MPYALATMIALSVVLSACTGKAADEEARDRSSMRGEESTGSRPPLRRDIVVDPARIDGAKGHVVEAPPVAGGCDFPRDPAWAGKLPPELALYPDAKLTEAAGSDAPGCRRRIVSFTSPASAEIVLRFYSARVIAAGYSAERLTEGSSLVLGGTRGASAYYISITPAHGGSSVDLVSNAG